MVPVETAEVVYRSASKEDTDQILDLLKVSLGEGTIPREFSYWSWKHHSNPFGRSPILVADADGQIVGLRVFMPWDWNRAGEIVHSVRAVDTATHPDWRGRGVFTRLTLGLVEQMRQEEVSFVYNTPNEQSRPGYLKMGWLTLGRVSLWIRLCRPLRLMRKMVSGYRSGGNDHDESTFLGRDLHPVATLLAQPGLEDLLRNLRTEDARLHTRLSSAYLRWRYADIPFFKYGALWSPRETGRAVVVVRLRTRGHLRELRICEILTRDYESSGAASKLLLEAIRLTRPDYVAAMAAPRTPERRALVLSGFFPVPRLGPILTVRPLSPERVRPSPLNRSAWRFSIGDLELF